MGEHGTKYASTFDQLQHLARQRPVGRETWSDESVVAWIDGACVCHQDARFRRAGCGIFFGIDDDRKFSFTLPGREQTNNRAELLAVITAMQVQDGNLEIRSDSEYVVRIAMLISHVRLTSRRQLDISWSIQTSKNFM